VFSVVLEKGARLLVDNGRRYWLGLIVAIVIALAGAVIWYAVLGPQGPPGGLRSVGKTSRDGLAVSVGAYPLGLALDDSTSTLYVASNPAGLLMLNANACKAGDSSRCRVRRVPAAGPRTLSVSVDGPAHTAYVANGIARTVSVINTINCNATTTRGCSGPAAMIRLKGAAQAMALDTRTGTLYVDMLVLPTNPRAANPVPSRQLAVISTKKCRASDVGGCRLITTIPLKFGLHAALGLDSVTDTVYAAEGSRLAVINGKACASGDIVNCTRSLAQVKVYGYISGISIASGMIYATSPGTGTLTELSARTCSRLSTAGCARTELIRTGAGSSAIAADQQASTLYVTASATNSVSILNLAGCRGAAGPVCSPSLSSFPVGGSPGPVVVDRATGTLYVGNIGSRSVSVTSISSCDFVVRRGCPTRPPVGTPATHDTPYSCDPEVVAYQSGQSAARFLGSSVRVRGGTTSSEAWGLWAKKGVFEPNGIEQGGLVVGGRWYALCSAPLSAGADANIELVDTGTHGTVYGYIQHPKHVTITLSADGFLSHPTSVLLRGTTFFIERLPRSACSYHTLGLHAIAAGWSGSTDVSLGTCVPGLLVDVPESQGSWGPEPRSSR
jgi:DNA-binding beta-propeller fold protein YncE